jgi:hypothetical protein
LRLRKTFSGIIADEFEACPYQLANFLFRVGYLRQIVIVLEVDEVSVDKSVVDVSSSISQNTIA